MKYVKIAKTDVEGNPLIVGPDEYAFIVDEVADESFDQMIKDGYSEATYGEFYATQSPEVQANLEAPEVALPVEVAPEVVPEA